MSGAGGRAGRLWRTVRHLRARQLAHLVRRRAGGLGAPPRSGPALDPVRAPAVLDAVGALGPVGGADAAARHAAAFLEGRLLGLGLDVPWDGDWRTTGPNPLWRYHLLYHDHLADLAWCAREDAAARRALEHTLARWDDAWGAGGGPAWDAYPVSVRLVNWMRILAWTGARLDTATRTQLERGIGIHAAHLAAHLEWHLDGNHLLRDAAALATAAPALDGSVGPSDLFDRITAEQVLADGWHEERSPMYHARALRDALEVLAARGAAAAASASAPRGRAETAARLATMLDAFTAMRRADGSLWTVQDSAGDLGVALDGIEALAGRAGIRASGAPRTSRAADVRHFDAAGYTVVADRSAGDALRIDRGSPGPAHQPAHAHAAALAFEWDVAGIPCVMDPGCSGYDGDPWRAFLRSTAAHATVAIGDRDQSEMWATFRVGGRAAVRTLERTDAAAAFRLVAECRPWHTPSAVHRREFRRDGRAVCIEDRVTGAGGQRIAAHLTFGPEWEVAADGPGTFRLSHPHAHARCRIEGAVSASLHRGERSPLRGWHARGFNDVVPAWTLRLEAGGDAPWRTLLAPA